MTNARPASSEFHLNQAQLEAVDVIARETARDRQTVLGEAVDAYIELHRWHVAHIEEGLRQAKAGDFADGEDVRRVFRRDR